jgi:VanZ family protein
VLAAALVTIGIVLELVQGLSAARSAELLDVLANTAGVLCGWLLGHTRAATALQALERTLTRISV